MKYDAVIIGSGPGGYVAAIRCAQLGIKVCVIEKKEIGGTCLNIGCIPTKSLVCSANLYSIIKKSDKFGIHTDNVSFNWTEIQNRKNRIVKQLRDGIKTLFKSHGIELIKGEAKSLGKESVSVVTDTGQITVESKNIIIATGSVPATIPGITVDGKYVITSDELLSVTELPESILIVGGGVIGVEFACILNNLGVKVTVIEMLDRIIPTEDTEISGLLKQFLIKDGIDIRVSTVLKKVDIKDNTVEATVCSESKQEIIKVDKILIATGRIPSLHGLDISSVNIKTDKNRIIVNNRMQTNIEGVYAVGDITGGILLAHVASAEGIVAAENIAGLDSVIDCKIVPNCIFTSPEVASVGLTESKAISAGYKIKSGKFPFIANSRAITMDETRGLIKVIVDSQTESIIGIHIIGPEATELIMQGSLALKLETIPEEFKRIIYAHPTLSESVLESVHDVNKEAIDLPKKV